MWDVTGSHTAGGRNGIGVCELPHAAAGIMFGKGARACGGASGARCRLAEMDLSVVDRDVSPHCSVLTVCKARVMVPDSAGAQ
jgi:hypothetical protein